MDDSEEMDSTPRFLRMSLLMILGFVVLECQAKPAEPSIGKDEFKDSPLEPVAVQETKLELDDGFSDALSLLETRLKRAATTDNPVGPGTGTGTKKL